MTLERKKGSQHKARMMRHYGILDFRPLIELYLRNDNDLPLFIPRSTSSFRDTVGLAQVTRDI